MDIGKAIRELRKEKGLSQDELAAGAAITQAALSQIENGKRPGTATLDKICQTLQVPVSLVYINSIEKGDVPENKQVLYEQLFPVIKNMVSQIVKMD